MRCSAETTTKEKMNNSTVNFTSPESSTNSTTNFNGLLDSLDICVYSINLIFALPTHSYIIWLIVTGTGSEVASGFFILNFSVCEIGNCVNSLFNVLDCTWVLKPLTWFLLGLGNTGHPLFQCLICVERYLAVVHPVTFLKYKPLRYRVIYCTAAWIITLGSCLCGMFVLVSFNFYIYVCINLLQFLVLVSIQLFCCVAVLRALKQSGPGERGRERGEENHIKRKAFYIILITTVSMVIIYWPFTVTGFLFILTKQNIKQLFYVCFIFYILAGFVQPFLFLHRAGKLSCIGFP